MLHFISKSTDTKHLFWYLNLSLYNWNYLMNGLVNLVTIVYTWPAYWKRARWALLKYAYAHIWYCFQMLYWCILVKIQIPYFCIWNIVDGSLGGISKFSRIEIYLAFIVNVICICWCFSVRQWKCINLPMADALSLDITNQLNLLKWIMAQGLLTVTEHLR